MTPERTEELKRMLSAGKGKVWLIIEPQPRTSDSEVIKVKPKLAVRFLDILDDPS